MSAVPFPNPVPVLAGIADWAQPFEVVLCDIWGVVHDGLTPHRGACEALGRLRQAGKTVVLVSNAPRPGVSVVPHLDQLGVPRTAWDAIVTSGDVTRAMLEERVGQPYFWLGPPRDTPLFEGFKGISVPFEEASCIVATGLIDDETETPDDYRPMLETAKARGLDFICANPDLIVERGGDLIYCAGALAQLYEEMGGRALYAGKPYPPIYAAALRLAGSIRKGATDLSRVVAIGDALRTDVAGATTLGCASLFVARGIHGHELGLAEGRLGEAALSAFLATASVRPTAAIDTLAW